MFRMKFDPMKPAPPVTKNLSSRCSLRCQRPFLAYSRHLIRSGFGNQVVRVKQGFERARVRPPPVQNFVGERSFIHVEVIHIRDFQFSSARRLQPVDFFENSLVVEINSDYGIVGFRNLRLFLDPDDLPATNLRHAKPLGVVDFFQ